MLPAEVPSVYSPIIRLLLATVSCAKVGAPVAIDWQLSSLAYRFRTDKMQSETADFDPGAAIVELDETYASSLILACFVSNMTSFTKPEVHNVSLDVRGGQSHDHR